MKSYRNTALTRMASLLKLNVINISCGTFTGKWTCTLPFNRLIYIFESGQTQSRIYNNEAIFEMLPGHWLFIPAGVQTSHDQHDGLKLISLQFNMELITGNEYMNGCRKMYMGEAQERRDDFFSLMGTNPDISNVFTLQKLIWDFILPAAEKEKDNLHNRPDGLAAFRTLCDEFSSSPYRDFSVTDMARIMKMGKESFIKHFTAKAGISPKLFFHRLRAAAAAKELLATEDTIREIAERFNFSDEFYFSRFMKRMTGLSPREYRKRMLLTKTYIE